MTTAAPKNAMATGTTPQRHQQHRDRQHRHRQQAAGGRARAEAALRQRQAAQFAERLRHGVESPCSTMTSPGLSLVEPIRCRMRRPLRLTASRFTW